MTATPPTWQHPFHTPLIAWFNLATQQPARGIVCHNATGVYQLYAWDVPKNTLTQLTFNPNGTILGALSSDGDTVYYLEDAQGGQIGHFFRVGFAGDLRQDLTPDWVAYTSFYITESYSGNFYGFMTANQYGFQMFVVDSQTGTAPHLRFESEHFSTGPFLSHDAEITVIATTENDPDTLHFGLESYDTKTGTRLHSLWEGAGTSIQAIGFINRAHDMRFLAVSNRAEWECPFIWNARTGERLDLALGDTMGDFTPLDWSSDGETLLLSRLHLGRQFLHTYHLKTRTLSDSLEWTHDWHITHAHLQGEQVIALAQNTLNAPCLMRDGQVLLSLTPLQDRPIRYLKHRYSDGVVTSAWHYGEHADRLLYLHAEPFDQVANQFSPSTLAWDVAGYSVVAVNYRGSTSFGKTQQHSIIGTLGERESDDIAEFTRDGSDPAQGKTVLMGSAYGGFLVLRALSQHPERFTGGFVVDGIADWTRFYEDSSDEERAYIAQLMGGTPQQVPERYRHASPMTHAERVQRPIFILQSRNNPRYPAAQMLAYVDHLHTLGKTVTLTWADDPLTAESIHGWALACLAHP